MKDLGKIAYVVDSTFVTNAEQMNTADLYIQPLYAVVDDVPYKDFVDVSTEKFYTLMTEGHDLKTSQPALGDFVTTFEDLKAAGYDEILVFLISSGLSGTYNTAVMAAEMVDVEHIHVMDTKLSSAIGGAIVQEVMQYAAIATSVTEILQYAQDLFDKTKVALYMGSLSALQKGGRISTMAATVGNMLQVKPILTFINGSFEVLFKERTEKKALRKVVEYFQQYQLKKVIILHTNDFVLRDKLIAEFVAQYPDTPYEVYGLSPVLGVHIGESAAAIFAQYK